MLLISILSAQKEINRNAPTPEFFNFEIPESEVGGELIHLPLQRTGRV